MASAAPAIAPPQDTTPPPSYANALIGPREGDCLQCGARFSTVWLTHWCDACRDESREMGRTGPLAACEWFQTALAVQALKRRASGKLFCDCDCGVCAKFGKHVYRQCHTLNTELLEAQQQG